MPFHPDFNPPAFAEFTQGPTTLLGFRSALLDLAPSAYYRFTEPADSSTAIDATGQQPDATHHGPVTTGAASSLPLDPDPAITFPGSASYTRSPITPTNTGDFTILFRFSPLTQTAGPAQVFTTPDTASPILLQAEQYHRQTPGSAANTWTLISEGSNGSAVQALPDLGNLFNTNYTTQSPRLDYTIHFTEAGVHYAWIFGRAGVQPSATSDSLHVGLNQTATPSGQRISSFGSSLAWSNTTMDATRASIDIPAPGIHDLSVWMREDGFILDRILLTTDPDFDPTTEPLPADATNRDAALRPLVAGYANASLEPNQPALHLSLLHQDDNLTTLRYQLGAQAPQDFTVNLNAPQWYSIALLREGTVGRLYLNGVLIHAGPAGNLDLSHPLDFGGSPRDDLNGLRYANTQLDEFAYFQHALSAESLLQLHQLAAES
ncbi:MAG: LamG-like jellyroll fold domain-containing protein [Planctomycetota bacterium]